MKCPRCNSPSPERHPAVQHGGEVQVCSHHFHEGVSYDVLDHETQAMVDAVLGAHVAGAMHEGDAVRIMRRLGMQSGEAIELLDAERLEAAQP